MTTESPISSQVLDAYYTALFEAFPGNCILLQTDSPRFTILAATPAYLAQTGQTKESLPGKGFLEALSPNNIDADQNGESELLTSFLHVLHHKTPHFLPIQRYDLQNSNGSFTEMYWEASNVPVFSPDGKVAYIIHSAKDITERVKAKQREEDSAEDLKRFKFMADHAQDPFILMREDGSFAYLNKKALDAWGYTEEEAKLIRVPDVDPIYQHDAFMEVFAKAQRHGEILQFETLHNRKDGTVYPVEVNMNGINLEGKPHLFAVARNITDRKKVQTSLQESETRFRTMVEQAPVAIALTRGTEIIIESINMRMLQIMNRYSRDEVLGKKLLDVLPELKGQPALQTVLNVQKTGIPFRGDEQPVDLMVDGELKRNYFNFSYTPIVEEGKTAAVLHVAVDVTEQVMARRKIEESEGRFRLLADASPILIWMLNPDGSYNYVNKTTLAFLGITQEAIAAVGWGPFQHPDDLERATKTVSIAVQSQQPYELEHRLRHKDGEYRWVLSQAIPAHDGNGNVFAYVGSSIDINETKKSRQELQTALEQVRLSKQAAELGTFDMDLETNIMHWDDRCRTLFGISHHEPVSFERDFINGLHPDDQVSILKIIDNAYVKAISNGEYDVEYRTLGAEDGVLRWVRAKGKVYFNSNDKPVRFIGSVLDITEKVLDIQKIEDLVEARTKELALVNDSLLKANKELQRSNENLEEFAHAASHDLKEPIRKIHYFTSQLKGELLGHLKEKEVQSFSRIENATERMGNLIDDLLLYSYVSHRPLEWNR